MVYFALISLCPWWGNQPVVNTSFPQELLLHPMSFTKPSHMPCLAFAGELELKQLEPARLIEL